ncbi:MAG: hypothetical protein AAB116_16965, partial [Candidatus Poribacteria bacterium]
MFVKYVFIVLLPVCFGLYIEQSFSDDDLGQTPKVSETEAVVDEAQDVEIVENNDAKTISGGLSQADVASRSFWLNYFGIFYGPSVTHPSGYQPTPSGEKDLFNPIILKNYLSLGYEFSEKLSISGTAYWLWRPVMGQQFIMRDPYIRLGLDQIIHTGGWNLYADARVHFPVTLASRDNDLLAAFQSFQVLTFQVANLTIGTYNSIRYNYFGKQGFGNDLELYLGPNLYFRMRDNLSLTLLYEVLVSHAFGERPFVFSNDGTNLSPGVAWDVTPNFYLNPYI